MSMDSIHNTRHRHDDDTNFLIRAYHLGQHALLERQHWETPRMYVMSTFFEEIGCCTWSFWFWIQVLAQQNLEGVLQLLETPPCELPADSNRTPACSASCGSENSDSVHLVRKELGSFWNLVLRSIVTCWHSVAQAQNRDWWFFSRALLTWACTFQQALVCKEESKAEGVLALPFRSNFWKLAKSFALLCKHSADILNG